MSEEIDFTEKLNNYDLVIISSDGIELYFSKYMLLKSEYFFNMYNFYKSSDIEFNTIELDLKTTVIQSYLWFLCSNTINFEKLNYSGLLELFDFANEILNDNLIQLCFTNILNNFDGLIYYMDIVDLVLTLSKYPITENNTNFIKKVINKNKLILSSPKLSTISAKDLHKFHYNSSHDYCTLNIVSLWLSFNDNYKHVKDLNIDYSIMFNERGCNLLSRIINESNDVNFTKFVFKQIIESKFGKT